MQGLAAAAAAAAEFKIAAAECKVAAMGGFS